MGDTKIPLQELEPKVQRGLTRERGHNSGIIQYMYNWDFSDSRSEGV